MRHVHVCVKGGFTERLIKNALYGIGVVGKLQWHLVNGDRLHRLLESDGRRWGD